MSISTTCHIQDSDNHVYLDAIGLDGNEPALIFSLYPFLGSDICSIFTWASPTSVRKPLRRDMVFRIMTDGRRCLRFLLLPRPTSSAATREVMVRGVGRETVGACWTALSFFGIVHSGASPDWSVDARMNNTLTLSRTESVYDNRVPNLIRCPVRVPLWLVEAMIVDKVSFWRRWTTVFIILFALFTLASKLSKTSNRDGIKNPLILTPVISFRQTSGL